ncbi:MAG: flagellar motor protein [Deltaproteobacteria bacterium]|nr:flagellar motor protein [Deltaproteobacteria bacterium]
MDKATLLGILLGFGAVFGGQVLEGGHISALIQPTAFLIVVGGTLGATLVSFPLGVIFKALRDAKKALVYTEREPGQIIKTLAGYADKARRNGLLALEDEAKRSPDRFIKKGVSIMVDGGDAKQLQDFLEIEINTFEEEAKLSAEVFEAAGGFAPTIGIIGAVLGLIHVMNNLSNTAALGAGIAVAFVATIYGLMTANIICIPISTKLKKRMKEELLIKELTLKGLLDILEGVNPRFIVEKLQGFYLDKQEEK